MKKFTSVQLKWWQAGSAIALMLLASSVKAEDISQDRAQAYTYGNGAAAAKAETLDEKTKKLAPIFLEVSQEVKDISTWEQKGADFKKATGVIEQNIADQKSRHSGDIKKSKKALRAIVDSSADGAAQLTSAVNSLPQQCLVGVNKNAAEQSRAAFSPELEKNKANASQDLGEVEKESDADDEAALTGMLTRLEQSAPVNPNSKNELLKAISEMSGDLSNPDKIVEVMKKLHKQSLDTFTAIRLAFVKKAGEALKAQKAQAKKEEKVAAVAQSMGQAAKPFDGFAMNLVNEVNGIRGRCETIKRDLLAQIGLYDKGLKVLVGSCKVLPDTARSKMDLLQAQAKAIRCEGNGEVEQALSLINNGVTGLKAALSTSTTFRALQTGFATAMANVNNGQIALADQVNQKENPVSFAGGCQKGVSIMEQLAADPQWKQALEFGKKSQSVEEQIALILPPGSPPCGANQPQQPQMAGRQF